MSGGENVGQNHSFEAACSSRSSRKSAITPIVRPQRMGGRSGGIFLLRPPVKAVVRVWVADPIHVFGTLVSGMKPFVELQYKLSVGNNLIPPNNIYRVVARVSNCIM